MQRQTRSDAIDAVFTALANPTRRAVVGRLGRGSATTTELAAGFNMALPSFFKHLKVLERSGVVRSHKVGRVRSYALVPESLQVVEGWLAVQRDRWAQRLDQLDELLMDEPSWEDR